MLNRAETRRVFEGFVNGDNAHGGAGGLHGFVNLFESLLGLKTLPDGRRVVESKPAMNPRSVNLKELALVMLGVDADEILTKSGGYRTAALYEDASSAVLPGLFPNISAWNTVATGLLEATILAQFNRPSLLGDQLTQNRPTRNRQDKIIGLSDLADAAEEMSPGQPHPRTQPQERFVTTPETQKTGLALDITKEAVFFDRTTQLLDEAANVGKSLSLRKERKIIDVVIAVTNTYTYKGTNSNTFLSSGNRINTQSNKLIDWESVDRSNQLFVNMVDDENEEPIELENRQILVMPFKEMISRQILNATTVQTNTQSSTERREGANPLLGMGFELLKPSINVFKKHTDTAANGGLALSAAVAREYWYHGDFKQAFAWMENWAMEVNNAAPDSYTMRDQDLILSVFANDMGAAAVIEPRAIARNTG